MKKFMLSRVSSEMTENNVESASLQHGVDDNKTDIHERRCQCKENIRQIISPLKQNVRSVLNNFMADSRSHQETLTVSFRELFGQSLGVIDSSLQITSKVDIEWLLAQYAVNNENKLTPITLLYGSKDRELQETLHKNSLTNVTAMYVKPSLFGSHYTKMMIHSYTDGTIRVIVITGDLIKSDWENTNTMQGIWISPSLPSIESGPTGADFSDSDTHFKKDLLKYLEAYKLPAVEPWIQKVRNTDCTSVKVFFIASFPDKLTRMPKKYDFSSSSLRPKLRTSKRLRRLKLLREKATWQSRLRN